MALDHELTPTHRTIFSVSKDYFAAAAAELCDAFPAARIERVGLEAGRLTVERAGISEVAEACGRRPIVFVRHLMRELLVVPFNSAGDHGSAIADQLSELRPPDSSNCQVALQVWSVGSAPAGFRADELWCRVASALRHRGFDVARAGREPVLSVCLSPSSLHLGINNRSDALVDWPGGRVGLSRSADQLSRSEFKLEELFKVFDVTLPEGGVALDLGASPGGWTRLLRERGMTVWAVDPATLDPRIEDDNRVHHARTTAGAFLAHTEQTFDLIVNDMRMGARAVVSDHARCGR